EKMVVAETIAAASGLISAFGTILKSTLDVFGVGKKEVPPPQQPTQNGGIPGDQLQPTVQRKLLGPSNHNTTMNQNNTQSASIDTNLNSTNNNVNAFSAEANNQHEIINKQEGQSSDFIIGLIGIIAILAILAILGFVASKVRQKVVSVKSSRKKASGPTPLSSSVSSSKTSTTRTDTKNLRR
uniref:Syndecan domain-containing protein n=2 Tax=Strongyloides papillosus TaxID=174720 RepID=A0A0N5BR80_STREA